MAYLALIVPVGGAGGYPDQGLPGQPVYPSTGPGFPTHPIAPGGGINYPSQGLPGGGPVDPGYGRPGWSPVDPGYGHGGWFRPSQGLPGSGGRPDQSLPWGPGHPSQGLPGGGYYPSHPIYFPEPDGGGEGEAKPPGMENLPPIIVWIPGLGYIRATPGVPGKPQPEPSPEPTPQ